MNRNKAVEKVSHQEALGSCVDLHALDGYIRIGPIGLNLVGIILLIVVCALRFSLIFFSIPQFLLYIIDLLIGFAFYSSLLPTVEPIRISYMSYVRAVFRDENQIKATKLKQIRNFYGD